MRLRFILLGLCLLLTACSSFPMEPIQQDDANGSQSSLFEEQEIWVDPIDRASARVTKKPFGIFITPADSPVQPERFTGYHTGTDFELSPEETGHSVTVRAVCTGPMILKLAVKGYGGVAIQQCVLYGEPVTVLYGHLARSSIQAAFRQNLSPGEPIGTLGTGFSKEADGERAHLHFAIHCGDQVEMKGYVQTKEELDGWVDAETVLGLLK